jgi:hypothetical protein
LKDSVSLYLVNSMNAKIEWIHFDFNEPISISFK